MRQERKIGEKKWRHIAESENVERWREGFALSLLMKVTRESNEARKSIGEQPAIENAIKKARKYQMKSWAWARY